MGGNTPQVTDLSQVAIPDQRHDVITSWQASQVEGLLRLPTATDQLTILAWNRANPPDMAATFRSWPEGQKRNQITRVGDRCGSERLDTGVSSRSSR
jgi:hypothetical protein